MPFVNPISVSRPLGELPERRQLLLPAEPPSPQPAAQHGTAAVPTGTPKRRLYSIQSSRSSRSPPQKPNRRGCVSKIHLLHAPKLSFANDRDVAQRAVVYVFNYCSREEEEETPVLFSITRRQTGDLSGEKEKAWELTQLVPRYTFNPLRGCKKFLVTRIQSFLIGFNCVGLGESSRGSFGFAFIPSTSDS